MCLGSGDYQYIVDHKFSPTLCRRNVLRFDHMKPNIGGISADPCVMEAMRILSISWKPFEPTYVVNLFEEILADEALLLEVLRE
jgi:hypothetical protein